MNRGAEFSLSFGVIFSILIIIATLAVAGYVLMHFLNLKNCAEFGLYGRDLQKRIDRAWNSDIVERELFSGFLPSSVREVCFGEVSRAGDEYRELKKNIGEDFNLFFYPVPKSCDITRVKLNNVRFTREFDCVEVVNGKATIRLDKGSFDSVVSLCKDRGVSCAPHQIERINNFVDNRLNDTNFRSNDTNFDNLNINENWCRRAQAENLCDGLAIASERNNYKAVCCRRFNLCC